MGAAVTQHGIHGWRALSPATRLFVSCVIGCGAALIVVSFPTIYPRPALFAVLLVAGCLTSLWKVTLPVASAGHATLSMSYAANLMALLLLGPRHALIVAVAGVWAQSTMRRRGRYPQYRTAFNIGAEALTMAATGVVYTALGGPPRPHDLALLAPALVGAIVTYFAINTGLVATAIGLSTGQRPWSVWRDDFLWSGASFMVAGSAGAVAAVVIERGDQWAAILLTAPVYLTYRTYLLFVARLEDQKRHEQALSEAKERAEQANRLKDQFLAIVSHELRTPLNAILGWADMLRSGTLDVSRHSRASHAIYDSAKRQAQLVDELLDGARIMSGKLRVETSPVDLNAIVRRARDVIQPAADAKRIRVMVEGDGLPVIVEGDDARLQQVTWNLLTNAVKFTPEGGTIRARVRRLNESAELSVIDTGHGISQAFLPAVFEPFRQADGSATRAHGGLGLGLTIVKHIVEAHGGTVRADSAGAGMGATFTIRVPLAAGAHLRSDLGAHSVMAPAVGAESQPSLEGLSVLVVDDDAQSRQVMAAHLESHRAVVLTATSAAEAFEVLQREHPDVLLADVAMPGEDGYSLIRKLRATAPSHAAAIPAVAVTAFARDEDRQEALRAGFQLHLVKPIEPRSLVAAVARIGKLTPT
jgi:signal transduction histidine kinase/ActR/RegA family two-component response regulator